MTEARDAWATTVVVDSMQVYREIPTITNQARERPAKLVGIVPVTEEWTVARHREAAWREIEQSDGPVVLDAGTGMYLNAVILDVPLAPKVSSELRSQAQETVQNRAVPPPNLRRAVRHEELRLSGAPGRGSIWDGPMIFDLNILYLRPDWDTLRSAIDVRSSSVVRHGLEEARVLDEMQRAGDPPNQSVAISIGVRELVDHLRGEISIQDAEDRIATRTRRLARRQIRWFDKLSRTLQENAQGNARTVILDAQNISKIMHCMHDIMGE